MEKNLGEVIGVTVQKAFSLSSDFFSDKYGES